MPDAAPRKPSAPAAGRVRVGIAGWVFPPWRGTFYPEGLRQKDELRHAARAFTTLEVNGTFYAMQRPETFAAWAAETPDDFVFALKGPRFVTHMKRLRDCEAALANFLASGPLRLGAKLGPILWQLPPNLGFEPERLEAFLALLPHDRASVAALAAHHEPRMAGRAWLEPGEPGPVRHVVEARHASFADPACAALLRRHGVALAVSDGVPDWPRLRELTAAGFAYARLHLSAAQGGGAGGYEEAKIAAWADRARGWAAEGRDVFVVFDAAGDETVKLRTPANAAALLARLGAAPAA